MARFLLLVLVGCVASCQCGDDCRLPARPVVMEVPSGLGEPLSCNEASDQKCCSWVWEGCMYTFCTNQSECSWDYKSGLRVDFSGGPCPVPQGYVQVEVTPPDWD